MNLDTGLSNKRNWEEGGGGVGRGGVNLDTGLSNKRS